MIVEVKETLIMGLLKMCNIRKTTNTIIAVQFVLGQKRAKA
jgi:hypothetical protein